MSNVPPTAPGGWFPLGRRNLFVLAAALACIAAGYGVLSAGHASPAAVLLVLGYCVLLPLGLVL